MLNKLKDIGYLWHPRLKHIEEPKSKKFKERRLTENLKKLFFDKIENASYVQKINIYNNLDNIII